MTPQLSIAHYRVHGKLGEGGMGAVYRAMDTKLNRDVAIKVLPDAFAADPDRLARFDREAQVLAGLNHPNIAAIYGVEDRALIMELVDGPTLADRLEQGPIPPDEAARIAVEIAEALEYAHDKGVIHRDLKPANIKIAPDGRVKVLDFGLAKALTSDSHAANPAVSPTLTMRATAAGLILGTAAYMSPEQAKGRPVDRRADIWAFGVVLYEMLTGARLYDGETVSETLAAVLTKEPDWTAVPARFRSLLHRCLDRDAKTRLRDIGEARIALQAPVVSNEAAGAKSVRPWVVGGLSVALAVSLAALVATVLRKPPVVDPPVRHFVLTPRSLTVSDTMPNLAISPDGKRIAYIAEGRLWVREMDRDEPRSLEGGDGAQSPFWSPDSQWVAYMAREQLWRSRAQGGPPVSICSLASLRLLGGTFSPDGGTAVISVNRGLYRVPTTGGSAELAVPAEPERGSTFFAPQFLPPEIGADLVLAISRGIARPKIVVINLRTREIREIADGAFAAYSPEGYLIADRGGNSGLWASGVTRELAPNGQPFPVANSALTPSVSNDGTLVYGMGSRDFQLVYRDRAGNKIGVAGPTQPSVTTIAVSPDGKKVALNSYAEGRSDIWIHDLVSRSKTRASFLPGVSAYPKWSPDGKQLAFRANNNIVIGPADGTSEARVVLKDSRLNSPGDWSRDGNYIAYSSSPRSVSGTGDVSYLARKPGGDFAAVPFADTPHEEASPRISPNGKYLAYLSNESGRFELYVRPFPSGQGKWQISNGSALQPRWSRDGRELLYLDSEYLMSVLVTTEASFSAGQPQRLFSLGSHLQDRTSLKYDLMPDGRILVLEPADSPGDAPRAGIHIIENWVAAFRPK
jgi:Tol biopolymer transport system component/predicted Ser/Thr protein kinase